jgi:hypothetical protein
MSVAGVYKLDGTGPPSALAAAALVIAAAMAAAAIAIVAVSEAAVAVAVAASVPAILFAVLDAYVTLTANAIVSVTQILTVSARLGIPAKPHSPSPYKRL